MPFYTTPNVEAHVPHTQNVVLLVCYRLNLLLLLSSGLQVCLRISYRAHFSAADQMAMLGDLFFAFFLPHEVYSFITADVTSDCCRKGLQTRKMRLDSYLLSGSRSPRCVCVCVRFLKPKYRVSHNYV